MRRGAGSTTCRGRTSGAQLQQRFADLAVHLAQHQLKNLHRRSASAANTRARRMELQDNVRAVVVKEVQLRDPVLTGALHCCSRAIPSTSSPTLNCPMPRLIRRPPCRPQRGHHRQGRRSERRAACRPTDYGARARVGGTCLVAVLHAASVIGCWGCATGAASLRTAPDAPPPHLMMLAA